MSDDHPLPLFTMRDQEGHIIAKGPLNALMEQLPGTHARSKALQIFADAAEQREIADQRITQAELREQEIEEQQLELQRQQVALLSEGITKLSRRVDAMEGQQQEGRAREIIDYLDSFDPEVRTHHQTGGLSPVDPVEPRFEDQDPNDSTEVQTPRDPVGISMQ